MKNDPVNPVYGLLLLISYPITDTMRSVIAKANRSDQNCRPGILLGPRATTILLITPFSTGIRACRSPHFRTCPSPFQEPDKVAWSVSIHSERLQ